MTTHKILMVAGEASADRHASHVIRAIRQLMPDAEIFGMGGPEMAQAGMECIFGMDELSVMGFTDVMPKIFQIIKVYRGIKQLMDERRPGLFIPVDLPDFNMWLARYAKAKGYASCTTLHPRHGHGDVAGPRHSPGSPTAWP